MASVNRATLIGHLGRDPQIRHMPSGEAVANFSIATTEKFKSKNGDKKEITEWHNITAFGVLADVAEKYLKKGAPVYIEGRIRTRKWEKDGAERYITEIVCERLQMLGGGGSHGDDRKLKSAPEENTKPAEAKSGGFDDMKDDIPF